MKHKKAAKTRRAKPDLAGGGSNGVLVAMRFPPELYQRIEETGRELGLTAQGWIGAVVRRALKRGEDVLG